MCKNKICVLIFLFGLLWPFNFGLAEERIPSAGYTKDAVFFKPGAIVVRPKTTKQHLADAAVQAYVKDAIIVRPRGMAAGDVVDDLDDYNTVEDVAVIADPFEKWNRFWFSFNDAFFTHVAKPVYRGWETVTPKLMRTGLKNFFHNILFPVRFVNNIFQGRFKGAGVEFSRFMLNTMTSAGFANPAKHKKTIVPMDEIGEDFGQTLGVWGIGHGPYLVWPFIGPSSLRETVGMIGDSFAKPYYYLDPWWVPTAVSAGFNFNNLDEIIPTYDGLKNSAIDPYISMREAYINYRNAHVKK